MVETISMEVKGKVPRKFLERIYSRVDQEYVRSLLRENGMPTDYETIENVATSYKKGFPTEDLALKAFETKEGITFLGIASGRENRQEKVAVKYLILEHFQKELAKAGIKSELNIADINPETIRYMKMRGMFKGQLIELKKIAQIKGNLENLVFGLCSIA